MFLFRGLYICLSVTFMHCAEMADINTISFAIHSPMSIPNYARIWLTPVNPFLAKFWRSDPPTPCWFERRWQIAAEGLEISQWSQWRAYRKQPFEWDHRSPPTTSPSLKMAITNALCRTNFAAHAAPSEYDGRFILHMSNVAFWQIILAVVTKESKTVLTVWKSY